MVTPACNIMSFSSTLHLVYIEWNESIPAMSYTQTLCPMAIVCSMVVSDYYRVVKILIVYHTKLSILVPSHVYSTSHIF